MEIKEPIRCKYVGYQTWNGPKEEVFPLICPVEETKWTPGWMPKLVLSNSSVIEKECIFITPNTTNDSIWIVTAHDMENFHLEMYQIIPYSVVQKYKIDLIAEENGRTTAEITYTATAIDEDGVSQIKDFTRDVFDNYMREWEVSLNYYLDNKFMISESKLAEVESSLL
jgi:hypothetical protein